MESQHLVLDRDAAPSYKRAMPALAMARWVLLRCLRHPLTGLGAGLAVALCWLASELSPVGLTTSTGRNDAVFYELAFVFGLAGSALALPALSEAEWFLARLDAASRLRARAAGLAAGGTLGIALAWLPPALDPRMSLSGLESWGLASLCTLWHALALGLLLLSAPLSGTTRALCLPLLAWVLPALTPASGPVAQTLRPLLDVSAYLEAASQGHSVPSLARCASLVALSTAAVLLETRGSRGERAATATS